MTKARNNTIDLLRLIGAFAVICLHNFSGSNVAWAEEVVALARFAVPLFFVFSGYFSVGFTARRKWMQAAKLFLLAVFSNLAYLGVDLSRQVSAQAAQHRLRELFSAGRVWDFLLFNESPISGHLWFLGALLYCVLLDILFSAAAQKLPYKKAALGALSALLLLGGLALYHTLAPRPAAGFQLYHYRNFLLLGLPFYLLGKLLKICSPLRPLPGWAYWVLIPGCCALALGEFKALGVWELYLGAALLALVLAHLAACHPLAAPNKPVAALAWLGRYASLPVYIVHIYFLDLIRGAYYAYLPWQREFGLYHMLALFTFLVSLAAGAAVGAVVWFFQSRRKKAGT
ncbi:acyltransferase [Acutalibacter caecimuris]|uniref:acyltransferase n=1 Tax=Acutalibacter caecimuris TaxID=3093657 RepID=UPI002AC94D07|nr:acyltransferase [Acutalibacter sp. M00118]